MEKQTAVSYLIDRIELEIGSLSEELIAKAKAIEKQQIVEAFDEGDKNISSSEKGEQYFESTYKTKDRK